MRLLESKRTDVDHGPCKSGRIILLFTRAPREEAKAKGLPTAPGSRLFAEFIRRWSERASDAGAELVAVTPDASVRSLRALLPDAQVLRQEGYSFGEQLESAFLAAFSLDGQAVITVPGDGPPLSPEALESAFQHLESDECAMVIAPSEDGGVSLLGFSPAARRDLPGVRWFSPEVCAALRDHARRFNLPLFIAASSADVDHIGDVRAFYVRSRSDSTWRPFRQLLAGLLYPEPHPESEIPAAPLALFFRAPQGRSPPLLFV